jgi:flagellar L-ring protein precursor FlgH
MRWRAIVGLFVLLASVAASAKEKTIQRETLEAYLARVQQQVPQAPSGSVGSLWADNGRLAFLTGDFKASRVGDLITVVVVQDVAATNANSVATNRAFSATSGISALAGPLSTQTMQNMQNLFSPNSTAALTGKSQAATTSSLQTTLAGRVVAVLPSGALVVEAERELMMNNEKQTIVLRGLVRPADIDPNNNVLSNAIGDLQLELRGKGVLSDGTRPPNVLLRTLLRLINF